MSRATVDRLRPWRDRPPSVVIIPALGAAIAAIAAATTIHLGPSARAVAFAIGGGIVVLGAELVGRSGERRNGKVVPNGRSRRLTSVADVVVSGGIAGVGSLVAWAIAAVGEGTALTGWPIVLGGGVAALVSIAVLVLGARQ
jgi:hypothetical protein